MNDSTTNGPADELLKGVCDIHLRADPRSSARSVNELSFAVDARQARQASCYAVLHREDMRQCKMGLFVSGFAQSA